MCVDEPSSYRPDVAGAHWFSSRCFHLSRRTMASSSAASSVHPSVQRVAGLLGRFSGIGKNTYPHIKDFQYEEEVEFTNSGRPFVHYNQWTWLAGTNRTKPMHEEVGFLRLTPGQKVEFLITQASGVQEILTGTWGVDPNDSKTIKISVQSESAPTRSPSAKPPFVTQSNRVFYIPAEAGGDLRYTMAMATDKHPELTPHLEAELKRKV
jgi:hypothetical protein